MERHRLTISPVLLGLAILAAGCAEPPTASVDAAKQELTALADEAATYAPRATYGGKYLLDLFNMAAAYVVAIAVRHPFLDGNKRTAAASALTFLYLNGYSLVERHPEELADAVLDLLNKDLDREQLGNWLRERAIDRE